MAIPTAVKVAPPLVAPFDVQRLRKDFPILQTRINGKPLVYLDNAATSQKPQVVIDSIVNYYRHENANVHRGLHYLSERATRAYEEARRKVRAFLNAREEKEIVFVRGATEAINLVAHSFGRHFLKAGDEVLITGMEHHANIVPWQMLRDDMGIVLRVAPIDDTGELLTGEFQRLLNGRTKLVSLTQVSNVLGTVNPVRHLVALAHRQGIPVLVDGAQAVPHLEVDVQDLDCDFYVFSGHKVYGPTGIGVLYGKASLLEEMPPYQGGGEMIRSVTFEKTLFADPPMRFEAGTPDIAGAVGLGAALDYLASIGLHRIAAYERELLDSATEALEGVPGLRLIGTAREKSGILSFVLEGVHPHDLGTVLDQEGIAIRAGHHCAMPVMQRFGVPATARASLAFYNTFEEIDRLIWGIIKAERMLS
jgi:cysteine desulfurase/selenocysteine lyase